MPYTTPWDSQFTSALQTPSPFGRAPESQMFNPFNVNTGSSGMGGFALQMILPQLMGQFMGQHGMQPSEFMPTQNFYDQMAAKKHHEQQQVAMATASRRDLGSIQQTVAGIMRLNNKAPLNQQQQEQSFQMAQDMQGVMPWISMFFGQETTDALMGSSGSATQLAQSIHRGMRTARDPVTGAFGVGGKNAGLIAGEIFEDLYGTREKTRSMGGITAGMAGRMYEELQVRGLTPAPSAYDPLETRLGAISQRTYDEEQERRMAESMLQSRGTTVNEENITGARQELVATQRAIRDAVGGVKGAGPKGADGNLDVAALADMPGVDEMLSSADAGRITSRLKNLAGAVNAMRDIFGDQGRPNAPMQEIINGLDALTQGGLATMSPGRIEQMVRTTKNLAKQSGIGVQGMAALTGQAATLADALGLDRSLAVTATQGSAAFSGAFRDTTRGDIPAFGALDAEQATLLDQKLRMHAAASFQGNAMGALVRMEREGFVGADTEAAAAALALRAGSREYEWNGQMKTVPASKDAFRALMKRSDVDQNFAGAILNDRFQNQEYIRDYKLGALARESQAEVDLMPRIGNTFSGAIGTQAGTQTLDTLRERGLADAGVEGMSTYSDMVSNVGVDVAKGFLKLNPEVYKDTDKRNLAMTNMVRQSIDSRVRAMGGDDADVAAVISSMGGEEGLKRAGVSALAALSNRIQYDPQLQGYKSIVGMLQLHGGETMQVQRARMAEAETKASMQSSLSRFGRAGPMARLVDTIQESPTGASIDKMLSKAFGGVLDEELAKAEPFVAFKDAMVMFNEAERFTSSEATQDEIDSRVASDLGFSTAGLRKHVRDNAGLGPAPEDAEQRRAQEDQAMAKYRADNADTFAAAKTTVDELAAKRIGELTKKGIQQRQLASDIVEGLVEGGVKATYALDRIGVQLKELPGIKSINEQLRKSGVSDDEKARLRDERRSSIVKAIDARLENNDVSPAERKELKKLRSNTLGLLKAEGGSTTAKLAEDYGYAMGQKVDDSDITAAMEVSSAAMKATMALEEPPAGADAATLKRHEEAKEDAISMQSKALDAGKSLTEAIMASSDDMQQLGQGGTELIQQQWKREQEISKLATDIGVTPAQLLAGDIPDTKEARTARKTALEKITAYYKTWKDIKGTKSTQMMPGRGKRGADKAMGKHEVEMAEAMAEFATGEMFSPQAQASSDVRRQAQVKEVMDRMLDMTSASTEEKFRGQEVLLSTLREQIGEGDRVMPMARALMARDEMVEMAAEQGLVGMKGEKLVAGAAAKGEGVIKLTKDQMKLHLDKLTGTQRQAAIDELNKQKGTLDKETVAELDVLSRQAEPLEGIGSSDMSLDEMTKKIDQFSSVSRRDEDGKGGDGKEKLAMTISGNVRVINPEMLRVSGDLSGNTEHNNMPTNVVSVA